MVNANRAYVYRFCSLMFCLFSLPIQAGSHSALICSVDDSQDDFMVYPSQEIYSSDTFSYYQLIDGLTVLVVNKSTMRFNRLSNLNLLAKSTIDPNQPPESYQLFSGSCELDSKKIVEKAS